MHIVQPLVLLFAAAAQAVPFADNALPAPAATADAPAPLITPAPKDKDFELRRRQDDNSTVPSEDVTETTTITVTDTITDFTTSTTEVITTSTVIATSTIFQTLTVTVEDVDTATKTVYETSTVYYKRWLAPMATEVARSVQDEEDMKRRGMVYIYKRATIIVTETRTDRTTVAGTTVITNTVVRRTTSMATVESTITTTEYMNAKTTVTTTSTIVVSSATEAPETTITGGPSETSSGIDGPSQSEDPGEPSGSSSSGGLSAGAKIGIGVGAGIVALAALGALSYYLIKKHKSKPVPDWYDPHNDLNDSPTVGQPTLPHVSPSMPGTEMAENTGYRGAAGPGTGGLGPIAGGAALGAGAGALAGRNGRKSWGASTSPTTVSPPSRYTTPGDAPPARPMSEMDGGQAIHAVEADSRPVVFEAPDQRYT